MAESGLEPTSSQATVHFFCCCSWKQGGCKLNLLDSYLEFQSSDHCTVLIQRERSSSNSGECWRHWCPCWELAGGGGGLPGRNIASAQLGCGQTNWGPVTWYQLFVRTGVFSSHWEWCPSLVVFIWTLVCCVDSASVQRVERFCFTLMPYGKWKLGSVGFLGLQKPRRGQGKEFHSGADQIMVISETWLQFSSTG